MRFSEEGLRTVNIGQILINSSKKLDRAKLVTILVEESLGSIFDDLEKLS